MVDIDSFCGNGCPNFLDIIKEESNHINRDDSDGGFTLPEGHCPCPEVVVNGIRRPTILKSCEPHGLKFTISLAVICTGVAWIVWADLVTATV
jgi:hypothetical protein